MVVMFCIPAAPRARFFASGGLSLRCSGGWCIAARHCHDLRGRSAAGAPEPLLPIVLVLESFAVAASGGRGGGGFGLGGARAFAASG